MNRRLAVSATCTALAAGLLPLATGAHAAGVPAGYPAAGCFDFTDPTGDAHAVEPANPNNDPDLDITGLALQSTGKDLKAYIKVAQLGDGPSASTDGHRFTLTFAFNGHIFSAAGSSFAHGTGAIRDGLSQTGQAGHLVQLSVDTPAVTSPDAVTGRAAGDLGYKDSGLTFTWDKTNSFVVIDLPVADIEKYGGAKFTGKLQALAAFSATDEYAVSSQADSTEPGNATSYSGVWQVGANKCFPAPKPATKKVKKKKRH
jgi:hypothetical protein